MKVLITGANGMVAQAVTEFCHSINDEVVSLARQDLDITDRSQVFEIVGENKPDAIINCAAYTDVDGAETNSIVCLMVNSEGVKNLARAAKEFDSRFVTISTDYVFDGQKEGFYTQKDTPHPQSVYAVSKLEGEKAARDNDARSMIVRTGWIYGRGGTNFLSVMHELLGAGKKIKVIEDAYGTPTYAVDLAERLRELAELDLPGIYHVTNSGKGTNYSGFAKKICEIGGFDENLLEVIKNEELKRPAARPVNSRLSCLFSQKFGLSELAFWEDAVRRFLESV